MDKNLKEEFIGASVYTKDQCANCQEDIDLVGMPHKGNRETVLVGKCKKCGHVTSMRIAILKKSIAP